MTRSSGDRVPERANRAKVGLHTAKIYFPIALSGQLNASASHIKKKEKKNQNQSKTTKARGVAWGQPP